MSNSNIRQHQMVFTRRAGDAGVAPTGKRAHRRRGAVAVLAMLFLVIIATLAAAMFAVSGTNVQTADNLNDVARAQAAAESGLRWMSHRLLTMSRPKTTAGVITPAVASTVWSQTGGIKANLASSLGNVRGVNNAFITVSQNSTSVSTTAIATDADGATFTLEVRQLGASDGKDSRYIRVTSTGRSGQAVRKASIDFQIQKRVKFAIAGRVPIQLGRNTIVEGPIAMGTANKYPPLLMLSDFMHFDTTLANRITSWNNFLKGKTTVGGTQVNNHTGYDNRVSVNNALEYGLATAAGFRDTNGDAYIDEYDLFLARFDTNSDKAVSKAEFTNSSTGKLYDADFFKAMDSINAPLYNEDANGNGVLDAGEDDNGNGALDIDPVRTGYQDDIIDNRDGYAKIRGQVLLAPTATNWQSNINSTDPGKTINDYIQGTIVPTDVGEVPIRFGVPTTDMLDLSPANFEDCTLGFKARTGSAAGSAIRQVGLIANTTLLASDVSYNIPHVKITAKGGTSLVVGSIIPTTQFNAANAAAVAAGKSPATSTSPGNTLDDRTPHGSTVWQATYRRPVFRGITFRNVQVPKGINALFEGCKFEGVTYVDMTRNITNSSGSVTTNKDDGMTWSKRMKSNQGSFNKDTALTTVNSKGFDEGNNLRFNNCKFEGPLTGAYATAYTHFTNSWEFTGETQFNNLVDQTATIVAPQANIEMGSFTKPTDAPSTLIGVVVAGNIDIRGSSVVDGSIIVTGDGAGNTTLAYFGASDADTNAGANPEGGYGRLNIRYNPNRALPDGINIAVDLTPLVDTYREGNQ